ncbi:unnamed protein product [Parajaminaea phylloscopi]
MMPSSANNGRTLISGPQPEPERGSQDGQSSTSQRPKKKAGLLAGLPGGNKALVAFALSLFAYTLQTEAAQYVQQGLGYRKPFLSLYLGHSGFSLLLPAHLLFLCWHTGQPLSHHLHVIAQNLHWQLRSPVTQVRHGEVQEGIRRRLSTVSGKRPGQGDLEERGGPAEDGPHNVRVRPARSQSWRESVRLSDGSLPATPTYRTYSERRLGFDLPRLLLLLVVLMVAITIPALSWYCAVPMTSMADITALYNTFSVWALVFSVWFLRDKWSRYKVASVLLACGGVVIVAYGGAEHRQKPKELDPVFGKPPLTSSQTASSSATPTSTGSAASAVTEAAMRSVVEVSQRALDGIASRYQTRAEGSETHGPAAPPSNPLLGDLLALFGAVTMAAYEMAFKLLGTLPDEDEQRRRFDVVQSSTAGSRARRGAHSRRSVAWQDDEVEEGRGLLSAEPADDDDNKEATSQSARGDATQRRASGASLPGLDGTTHLAPIHGERSAILDGETSSGYGSNGQASPSVWAPITGARGFAGAQPPPDPAAISSRIAAVSAKSHARHEDEDKVEKGRGSPLVTVRPVESSASSSADDTEEQESVLDDGDAEEIRSGSTRLQRTRSYMSARSALRHAASEQPESESESDDRHYKSGPDEARSAGASTSDPSGLSLQSRQDWIPPPLPFGLHANIMTAGIGATTLCTLWIGVLIAHLTGWEPFEWPHNWVTVFAILFVVLAGVIFNGCFMVLLAIWGPVTASVSCLLSTVAVALLDAVLGAPFSLASALGCALIMGGFALLLLEPGGVH